MFGLGEEDKVEHEHAARLAKGHQAFAELARHVTSMSLPEYAVGVWATAANFASADHTRLLATADEIVQLATMLSAGSWTALGLTRRAQALTGLALGDLQHRLAAFDATTAAIWHARAAAAQQQDALRSILRITDMENARVALESQPEQGGERGREAAVIHASWTTFSFDHPAHRRAVPHVRSLSTSEGFGDTVLELNHEITHIFTMMGHLGMAAAALRAAAVELEMYLWTFVPEDRQEEAGTLGVAPLDTSDVLALAEAEQCLEVSRKLQILQATWAPWLEGVAVYGELAADPSSERDRGTPIADVMVNLEDHAGPSDVADDMEAIEDAMIRLREKADDRYAALQKAHGPFRLRTYLQDARAKYLAGYLAVRSVISAWRDALRSGLTGAEAFEILLHITRFGTADAVPRLDLPVDDFAVAAEEGMLAWVDRTARSSAQDLTRLLSSPLGQGLGWQGGKLFAGELEDRDVVERHRQMVAEAMNSLSGEARSPLHRVPDADDLCRYVMRSTAEALAQRTPRPRLSEQLLYAYTDRMAILPLGTATAPFWLNERGQYLVCAFRTTERHADTGESSYTLVSTPLPDEEFAALRAEIAAHPGGRMKVTRVADLHFHGPEAPDRGLGRNLLVFQCGEWLTVQPRGLLTGTSEVVPELVDDIRGRLLPLPFIAAEERIAEGAGAARTAEWIASVDKWTAGDKDDGVTLPVEAWAQRVRGLAGEIEQGNAVYEVAANRALLRRLFPQELAEQLEADGLRAVVDDVLDLPRLARALHQTGTRRAPDAWLSSLPSRSPVLDIFQQDDTGWDSIAHTNTDQR